MSTPASGLAVDERLDNSNHLVPCTLFLGELPPARGRQRIEARLAIGVCRPPGAPDKAALLQSHQCRVERAHVELQHACRDLLQPCRDGVTMESAERLERLEHHQIERPLQDFRLCVVFIRHTNGIARLPLEDQMRANSHARLPRV
jgi:hypothetical protein